MKRMKRMKIGVALFDCYELLDVMGPVEVFGNMQDPKAEILMIAEEFRTVPSLPGTWQDGHCSGGVRVLPDTTFDCVDQLDMLLVPGGFGQIAAMDNPRYIGFLERVGPRAEYLVSTCVGALLLARAGLLNGHEATCHWNFLDVLALFPGVTVKAHTYPRYVPSILPTGPKCFTSGGVASGIDLALALVAEIAGEDEAKRVELVIQYQPDPPVHTGDPKHADSKTLSSAQDFLKKAHEIRADQVRKFVAVGP